jgi:hypothetical protein
MPEIVFSLSAPEIEAALAGRHPGKGRYSPSTLQAAVEFFVEDFHRLLGPHANLARLEFFDDNSVRGVPGEAGTAA